MKGILLAGGSGTRLYPATLAVSKQLLPVYNKPMIYYPLSVLMFAGIREILVISSPDALPLYRTLLGTGEKWGMRFEYAEQSAPRGLPEAYIIGRKFLNGEPSCLALGDNIFYGADLAKVVKSAAVLKQGAFVFAYPVKDPERYGVIEFDRNRNVVSLEEKPVKPKSTFAMPGLYFMDGNAPEYAATLKPSKRNELEILDLCRVYLEKKQLTVHPFGRGTAWLDAGTYEALLQSSVFIHAVEERQGTMIACPEEIAYRMGYLSADQLKALAKTIPLPSYREYLEHVAAEVH